MKNSQTLAADLFSLGLTIYYAISGGNHLFRQRCKGHLELHQVVHEGCLDIQNGRLDAFNELHADGNFYYFHYFLNFKFNSLFHTILNFHLLFFFSGRSTENFARF